MKKYLANLITSVRLIGAVVLIFLEPRSLAFLIVYGVCGLSDAIDGTVARMTNSASAFGAKLDSAADLLFYLVMMLRILPELVAILPGWIWVIVGAICLLRIYDYAYTAVKFKRFAALHSLLNKLTGAMIFLIPFVMKECMPFLIYGCVICAVAAAAVLQEIVIHHRLTPQDAGKA